jgi:hypothetical protein
MITYYRYHDNNHIPPPLKLLKKFMNCMLFYSRLHRGIFQNFKEKFLRVDGSILRYSIVDPENFMHIFVTKVYIYQETFRLFSIV